MLAMPLPPRLFSTDVEHGKKDDDHIPGKSVRGSGWQARKGPQRRGVKRVLIGFLVLIGLYYFFKNMPTDLQNPRRRPNYNHSPGSNVRAAKPPRSRPSTTPNSKKEPKRIEVHDFNGPIKFYNLAATLHAVEETRGHELINRNVLFAAASLKSTAILLPIACEMAIQGQNFVHFAFMGRDEIPMDILRSVNGIAEECKIIFHDARPDFSTTSSDFRMEVSSASGFGHINTFVHPQATFVDVSGEEESWLLRGVIDRAFKLERTVIELPENAGENLMWITLLDSLALSSWNKVSVDIVIHAQPSASGSLIRLLRSLQQTDFFSSAPPRLTIELPQEVDEPTKQFLNSFEWPPRSSQKRENLLTLHHRIPQHGLTPEENSIRMLESFWPTKPYSSHILVLSPQMELSPLFYHYLKYTVLGYKYSSTKSMHSYNLLSISLDLPSAYLNDTTAFDPPLQKDTHKPTPFLWQSPNSNAALYFGDKWIELHSFISQLLTSRQTQSALKSMQIKEVSKIYPSWHEHLLKLARARGYWTLYPNFDNTNTLATRHNDLFTLPEEYAGEGEETPEMGDMTADPAQYVSSKHHERSMIKTPLLKTLPLGGELPLVHEMPLLTWDGVEIELGDINERAIVFSELFRTEIGGCTQGIAQKPLLEMDASDLFCLTKEREV